MKSLICSEFELDFLKLFGIKVDETCSLINSKSKKRLQFLECTRGEKELKYSFQCEDGIVLNFFRVDIGHGFVPTVDLEYDGYHHWATESYFENENGVKERTVGVTSTALRHQLNESSWKAPKDGSYIGVSESDLEEYISRTSFYQYKDYSRYEKYYTLFCSLSSVLPIRKNVHSYESAAIDTKNQKPLKLSVCNYKRALKATIKVLFEDKPEEQAFYLTALPFLSKSFETMLTIPVNNREVYIQMLKRKKEIVDGRYTGKKREQELLEIEKMLRNLDDYFPKAKKAVDKEVAKRKARRFGIQISQ